MEEHPERTVLKLSDLYEVKNQKGSLEFETIVFNINYGKNRKLMNKCHLLMEYSIFIDKIRTHQKQGKKIDEAVEQAINECIQENILSKLLIKHRNEVFNMLLTEYDEQAHIKKEKQWSREEGWQEGLSVGRLEGLINEVRIVRRLFQKGLHSDEIADWLGLEKGYICRIEQLCQNCPDLDDGAIAAQLLPDK